MAPLGTNRYGRGHLDHLPGGRGCGSAVGGRGLGGRALAEHALAWARDQGYAAMQFNAVVESNQAAVRLWRALGFRVIGTVPEAFAHPTLGRVGLHVMHRRL